MFFKSENNFIQKFNIGTTSIHHYINLQKVGHVYIRSPDTIIVGLSKIGGLLGIFKVFTMLMRMSHRKRFENEVIGKKDDDAQEELGSENVINQSLIKAE